MRIAVIGAGGIGGIYGAALAKWLEGICGGNV
jgi:ketopantoate reductase